MDGDGCPCTCHTANPCKCTDYNPGPSLCPTRACVNCPCTLRDGCDECGHPWHVCSCPPPSYEDTAWCTVPETLQSGTSTNTPTPPTHNLTSRVVRTQNCLSVVCWNVCGASNKISGVDYSSVYGAADFVFLVETCTAASSFHLQSIGFDSFNYCHQPADSETPVTTTGGVAFCVRNEHTHAVKTQTMFAPSMLHVHLDGKAVGLDTDVHCACTEWGIGAWTIGTLKHGHIWQPNYTHCHPTIMWCCWVT